MLSHSTVFFVEPFTVKLGSLVRKLEHIAHVELFGHSFEGL